MAVALLIPSRCNALVRAFATSAVRGRAFLLFATLLVLLLAVVYVELG